MNIQGKNASASPLVFVSHSHEEAHLAIKLTDEISDAFLGGVKFFVSSDDKSIVKGDHWFDEIRNSLNRACIVLVVVSLDSLSSPWVNFEAGAVWLEKRKRVIPMCHPGLSVKNLPQPFASAEAVEICDPKDIKKLFTVIGDSANLRTPERDWESISKNLQQVCDLRLGKPLGSSTSWMFPSSQKARDAMVESLFRCSEIRMCGTGLNFLWEPVHFREFEERLRNGKLTAKVCLGNRNSPRVQQRINDEPPHHVSVASWLDLIDHLVKLRKKLPDPDRLQIRLFNHYPTYAILIFDDEYFFYPYAYQELGNFSPCLYWKGTDESASRFYSEQFEKIYGDSSPAT